MRWLALLLAGCSAASNGPSPMIGITPPPSQIALPEAELVLMSASASFTVDTRVLYRCAIVPASDDEVLIDRVAMCMSKGPLRGESLRIVAHRTDAPVEWSLVEAAARSERVAQDLATRGVDRQRLPTRVTIDPGSVDLILD